jgi:transcription antitermination protein NusB
MQRREARQFLLRALYQREFVDTPLAETLAEVDPGEQRSYIETAFSGIVAHQPEIDALASQHTVGWRFERLAAIDRSILRLGIYELLFCPDIPPEVAIDEAVELCKTYGTEHSQAFVNGILDRIWKEEHAPAPGGDS